MCGTLVESRFFSGIHFWGYDECDDGYNDYCGGGDVDVEDDNDDDDDRYNAEDVL
jgi:hypothetical protein